MVGPGVGLAPGLEALRRPHSVEKRGFFEKMDEIERKPFADLERHKKTAKTTRQLAWELLKQTRNPAYVALRYGYDVETMEKALKRLPAAEEPVKRRSDSAEAIHSRLYRASEVLPESLQGRSREPGEDDDLE